METRRDNSKRRPQGRKPLANDVPRPQNSRRMKRTIATWRNYGVVAFGAVMVVGCLIGLLWFARPTQSAPDVENRALVEFPEFTVETFLNGDYFKQLSEWYADTYPLRDPMVKANLSIKRLYGPSIEDGIHNQGRGDEIPVDDNSTVEVKPPADAPTEKAVADGIQENLMEGIFVHNGAGYSIYYFDKAAADTYIQAMNTAAERLDGTATVYSLFAPASSIMLDPETRAKVGGSDQQQTLDYLSTRFDSRVKPVEVLNELTDHNDEYLYFYTDHHWTELGAYYAYEKFCKVKGIEPVKLDDRKYESLGELEGTYTETISSMGDVRHDTVDAYYPIGTNEMTITGEDGGEYSWPVVNSDAKNSDPSTRYSAFISGDQPLEVIHNPQITDGSSVLLVKDSYGCAFAPLLVDSYEYVYIIDFRYTDKNIVDYVKENNIQDVIFLTGMKIGLVETVAETLLVEVS